MSHALAVSALIGSIVDNDHLVCLNVTIRSQNKSEILLRKLDDDYFGAQKESDVSAAAASHTAAESYESEEPSPDEDVPAASCGDVGTSLVHI